MCLNEKLVRQKYTKHYTLTVYIELLLKPAKLIVVCDKRETCLLLWRIVYTAVKYYEPLQHGLNP